MKKRRGIRWQRVTESKWNKEEIVELLAELGAVLLFDFVCVLLFQWAVSGMLTEIFPMRAFGLGFYVKILGMVLLVSLCMEIARRLKKWPACLTQLGILLVGIGLLFGQLKKTEFLEELTEGLCYMASAYVTWWNKYFGTDWTCPAGTETLAADAVEFVVLVIAMFLFWVAKAVRKNSVMALLPLFVLTAELLVGESPGGASAFLLFLGILVSLNQGIALPDFRHSEGKGGNKARKGRQFGWLIGALAILLVCGLVFVVGRQYADTLVTQKAGVVEDFFMDTANTVAEWEIWKAIEDPGNVENTVESILGKVDFDHETLDNDKPEFEDIPLLRMTVEERPQSTLYLKGFYADTYTEGTWEKNREAFEEACAAAGFEPDVVEQELAALGVAKLKSKGNVSKFYLHRNSRTAEVFYYDPNTIKAYLPYFIEENIEGVTADGEGNYKKRKSDEQLEFALWQYSSSYDTRLVNFQTPKKYEWEDWYEEYVLEQYLTVPDNMPNVEAVATELSKADWFKTKYIPIDSENKIRLAKAALVADWMGRNTTYSLILPELPKKTDPIEYFLGTSRKGYCMHYASASVMILRAMGVPARYASGYVVTRDNFRGNQGGYVAEILDNRAHAWVEIYLEGIGWAPVEVTAGYSTLLPTPTPTPTPTNTPTPTVTNTPIPTHTPVPTSTNTPVPTKAETPTPTVGAEKTVTPVPTPTPALQGGVTPRPTQSGTENNPGRVATATPTNTPTPTPDSEKFADELLEKVLSQTPQPSPIPDTGDDLVRLPGEAERAPLKWYEKLGFAVLLFLAAVGLYHLVLAPVFSVDRFFRFEKAYHRRLLREMRRGGNARAIKMVNRSIYRKLCFIGKMKPGSNDAEYEAVLRNNYSVLWPEDWDRYMEIVKAAEFSLREFTDEEVEFCYKIYRDVIY